jgi:pimeloyl-ACP methyl ester carboxylesterase
MPAARPRPLRRGRRGAVEEDSYRVRHVRGAAFFTSRQEHQDLTVVVKRFPSREEVEDDADAPVFILVHGLGVSSRYFHPLAAELAHTGRVFLVDLPGYGAAPDPRRDVSIVDHANALAGVVAEIADRWPAAGPPVLVGHSMGSNVIAVLAAEHPEVAEKIVLMAPVLQPGRRSFWRASGHLMQDAFREPPSVFGIAFTDYLLRCGLPYLLKQTRHLLADTPEERMSQLKADVLVICGDRDVIVSLDWGRELAGLSDSLRYLTVRGPHVVMHTDPVRIARHLVRFAVEGRIEEES